MNTSKKRPLLLAALILICVGIVFGVWQVLYLQKAHSSFSNYAAFRGCSQITSQTDSYGTCVTKSGEAIKIVKYDNRWFLDGDLPVCMISIGSVCLLNQP